MSDDPPLYQFTGFVICCLTIFPVCAVWILMVVCCLFGDVVYRAKNGKWPERTPQNLDGYGP